MQHSRKIAEATTWALLTLLSRADGRPMKITLDEMRKTGARGVLVYCANYRCGHSIAVNADGWPDEIRLSDIETRCVCTASGPRGAAVRPDFHWNSPPHQTFGTTVALPL